MVRKLSINENSVDRINDKDVTLTMSKKYGDLQSMFNSTENVYKIAKRELTFEMNNLEDAYEKGLIDRTVINGFNKQMDDIMDKLYEFNTSVNKLLGYSKRQIPDEEFHNIDSGNDWFRKRG